MFKTKFSFLPIHEVSFLRPYMRRNDDNSWYWAVWYFRQRGTGLKMQRLPYSKTILIFVETDSKLVWSYISYLWFCGFQNKKLLNYIDLIIVEPFGIKYLRLISEFFIGKLDLTSLSESYHFPEFLRRKLFIRWDSFIDSGK